MLGQSFDEFVDLIGEVNRRLVVALRKYPGASPVIVVVQRRYPTQRSPAIIDGQLRFDTRTAFTGLGQTRGQVKRQPEWLRLVYDILKNRRSNLQFQIGADFPYERCKVVATAQVREAVVNVWLACKLLLLAASD
jgi:hypothetical protein